MQDTKYRNRVALTIWLIPLFSFRFCGYTRPASIQEKVIWTMENNMLSRKEKIALFQCAGAVLTFPAHPVAATFLGISAFALYVSDLASRKDKQINHEDVEPIKPAEGKRGALSPEIKKVLISKRGSYTP
jgi:hypothetical protein